VAEFIPQEFFTSRNLYRVSGTAIGMIHNVLKAEWMNLFFLQFFNPSIRCESLAPLCINPIAGPPIMKSHFPFENGFPKNFATPASDS
jgi:hypothetical protein